MTIQIDAPELELLIRQRLEAGTFRSVEDLLLRAMQALYASETVAAARSKRQARRTPGDRHSNHVERPKGYPHPFEL